ncbi:MAG: hypothetical protein LQ337_005848 [Flavoplaca oasis]|nr:MAG: hypothetical protein LQ337_005848 [Flavoplaca oasis]
MASGTYTAKDEAEQLSLQLYKNIIAAIPVVENLFAAPTNDQRYKTLNRYRFHLRRFNGFLTERARKVQVLADHAQGASHSHYNTMGYILREPTRILEPWITTVWLLEQENTTAVISSSGLRLGDWGKAKKKARRGLIRDLRWMFKGLEKVCSSHVKEGG